MLRTTAAKAHRAHNNHYLNHSHSKFFLVTSLDLVALGDHNVFFQGANRIIFEDLRRAYEPSGLKFRPPQMYLRPHLKAQRYRQLGAQQTLLHLLSRMRLSKPIVDGKDVIPFAASIVSFNVLALQRCLAR